MRSHASNFVAALRPSHLALAIALVAGAAVGGASALAASNKASNKSVVISDPADATSNPVDITRVSMGRASKNRLKISVRAADDFDATDLEASKGPPGSVCVKMWTKSTPPDETPDYLVCVTSTRDEELRASVLRERANQLPRRVARAVISDQGDRSVTLLVRQASLHNPKTIDFAGESTRSGCVRPSCIDTAPNAPGTARLTLGTTKTTTTTTTTTTSSK